MYTLHPDKLLALDSTVGKKPKPAVVPTPPTQPSRAKRTFQLRPNLVESLAARLYNAQTGGR